MALQIVTGSSVSELDQTLFRAILREAGEHPERRFVFLAPEQFSLTVQEALVDLSPSHALVNIDVLTFQRFARKLFAAAHVETRDVLDDLGKKMMLRLAIEEKESELSVLSRSIRKEGMVDELNSVISEFAEYNVTPADLRARLGDVSSYPALQQKLSDITLLYESFLAHLHKRYDMAEEKLIRCAETIEKSGEVNDTSFYLYGYTGFTPPQYEVVRALLRRAYAMTVGITVGSVDDLSQNAGKESLFHMSYEMDSELFRIASEENVPVFRTRIPEGGAERFAPEIRHLEKNLFRDRTEKFGSPVKNLSIERLRSPKEEIAFAVSKVREYVREGGAFRDTAIALGDIDSWREEIEDAFREADVPFFIDENRPVGDMALFHFVTGALEVADSSFRFESVFDFLKNPIVVEYLNDADGYDRISEFENYALAFGIRGKARFTSDFTSTYDRFPKEKLREVRETRDKLLGPLLAFHEEMIERASTAGERIAAVRKLLKDYRASETLFQLGRKQEELYGTPVLPEYEAAMRYLNEFLDRAEEILGPLSLSAPSFRHVLIDALRSAVVGRVPATKDRVIIGDLKRSRFGDVKNLIVLGANESVLLSEGSGSGLINDRDREILKSIELKLSDTAFERAFNDRFYLYLLLTVPSDTLTLTYSLVDVSGKEQKPSFVLSAIRSLFPKLTVGNPEDDPLFGVNSEERALRKLAAGLSEYRKNERRASHAPLSDLVRALYARFEKEDADAIATIMEGLFYRYEREKLPEDLAETLYGSYWEGSVSRLEKYAECPYHHFLSYGLKLRERETFRLEVNDLGSLLHESIERFFVKLAENAIDWREISLEEQRAITKEAVTEVAAEYGNRIMQDSAKNRFLVSEIERVVQKSLWALKKHWEAGSFTETMSEVAFDPKDGLVAMTLDLSNGTRVKLRGKIDRLDTETTEDGRKLVKIIDYKSSEKHLSLPDVASGRLLQLPLYLKASMELVGKKDPGHEVVPAGIYYFYLHDPVIKEPCDDPENAAYATFRLKGLTNDDKEVYTEIDNEIVTNPSVIDGVRITKKTGEPGKRAPVASQEALHALADFAVEKAKSMAEEIASGEIASEPLPNGCRFCEFRAVCGFDRKIDGYRERTVDASGLLARMGGEKNEVDG